MAAIGVSTCIIRADGATTNGGGFVNGSSGVNYSNQAAAQWALTGVTSAGAGDTVLDANAHADMVGNWACVPSGTNFTQSFFAVVSVVAGVSITFSQNKAGTSICTGIGSAGVINIGGAFKLGATTAGRTDDDFLEQAQNTGGNVIYIKGSHTTAGNISLAATGAAALKHKLIGYNSSLTDAPTVESGNQPSINYGANTLTFATHWELFNITFTGTAAAGVTIGGISRAHNCKFSNTSGTANRAALTHGNTTTSITNCELNSTAGYALVGPNSNGGSIVGNYFHDSVSGFRPNAATGGLFYITGNIFDNLSTAAIDISVGAPSGHWFICNNTFYGAETPAGTALSIAASATALFTFINNIIYGWTTGANSTSDIDEFSDYNCFNNNTTARTNWSTGANDISSNPSFTNGASGDFTTGTNVQRVGMRSAFPGGLTAQYLDIGAAQSNYASWYTDVTVSKVLTSFGNFKYNSLSNNRTPTYNDTNLIDSNVKSGVAYGVASTGSYSAAGGGGGYHRRR